MKKIKEWFIEVPWGKIALVSWGTESGPKVLLGHGRQCNSASFIPLLEYLPDTFHYVAYDLPGHGLSDSYPAGLALTRFHMIPALIMIVEHLDWSKFTFIAHSLSTELCHFYNVVRPGRVCRAVHLDPGPSLYITLHRNMSALFGYYYTQHYASYAKMLGGRSRLYTMEEAVHALVKARPGFKKRHAELVLARNMEPAGDGKYRLTWDPRLKNPASLNLPTETFLDLIRDSPPTLCIFANWSLDADSSDMERARRLVKSLEKEVRGITSVFVDGHHDVHITNPEKVAPYVVRFLFGEKAKL